jgi:hypothetical protein
MQRQIPPLNLHRITEAVGPKAKQSHAVTIQYVVQYNQGCTNPGEQVVRAIEFCTVEPNIRGPSAWNWLHVPNLRTSRILRCLLDFRKIYEFLNITIG